MQRRKGRCGVQLLHYLSVDQAMLPQLRSAMHDTVTDRDGGRGAAVVKEFSDPGNRFPLGREWATVSASSALLRKSCA